MVVHENMKTVINMDTDVLSCTMKAIAAPVVHMMSTL